MAACIRTLLFFFFLLQGLLLPFPFAQSERVTANSGAVAAQTSSQEKQGDARGAGVIPLPGRWLFKAGDNPCYSQTACDDSDWKEISVPGYWEHQGYPDLEGYAWYRVHFTIPRQAPGQELFLCPGTIDDVDQTFLNGVSIGQSGLFPPDLMTDTLVQRLYAIPAGLLKEKNVLAVRVYDARGLGGIYGGTIALIDRPAAARLFDYGPAPKISFHQLTTSNGLIAAVYNSRDNRVEYVLPHLFRDYDLERPVKPWLKNLRLQLNEKPVTVSYLDNTHIIHLAYRDFSVDCFAPFSREEKILYMRMEGDSRRIGGLKWKWEPGETGQALSKEITRPGASGEVRYLLFSFSDARHGDTKSMLDAAAAQVAKDDILARELRFMKNLRKRITVPEALSPAERNLVEQSVSVLKMAQVSQKEVFPKGRGALMASLPPGIWNICWLRDGTYAIMALSRVGLFQEARQALRFYLDADSGYYRHFVYRDGKDHGVRCNYRLSVCRYFGMGKEESDFNENGPNIELDGFGLFLIAFSDYVQRSGDRSIVAAYNQVIQREIADPILTFMGSDGLFRAESGPWESHLPGRRFAFTPIVCAEGLRDYAELLETGGYGGYEKYREHSHALKNYVEKHLIYEGKLIKGFVEASAPQTRDFFDGGTFEAFSMGLFQDRDFFESHYRAYEKGLRISPERGFSRLNNPDWYTIGEWPFLNLRVAMALNRFGERDKARLLIDRTTEYSKLNYNLVPEIYGYKNDSYEGAVPMVGYGAGAYILALLDYYSFKDSGKNDIIMNKHE